MCELFCFNSKDSKDITEYLTAFYSHCNMHPHGWGLTDFKRLVKEPVKASLSDKLEEILEKPIISQNMFAHIRLATVGDIVYENCHPFTKKDSNNTAWTLMHNGTVFDFDELNEYESQIDGNTDSEKLLYYIVDEINKNKATSTKKRFKVIEDIIFKLSTKSKLNLMICDGEVIYVHTNFKNSMQYLKKDNSIIITTKALSDEDWNPVELNRLYCLKNGEIIYKSNDHGNTFEFSNEHINFFIRNLQLYFSKLYLKEIPSQDILKANIGIEWESVRVNDKGHLAITPHPEVFGDKSNPIVTTDFSESQLEVITKTYSSVDEAYEYFTLLSNFVNANLGEGEYMWLNSMPPVLPGDDEIPIARYGDDKNSEEYRINLALKYGLKKQMISGVHFNFSFSDEFLDKLYTMVDDLTFRDYKDCLYLKITRNYLRYSWLIIYLTGCTTACDETFTQNIKNLCNHIDDSGSYYTSKGCSLRNSKEGYKNLEELHPSYENIDCFVKDIEGYIQSNILSEAKELYTQIRLKTKDPQNILKSLKKDGIQYVEIRTIDLNPYNCGLIKQDMEFLQLFLIYMLVKDEINYPDWQKEATLNENIISEYAFVDNLKLYCNGCNVSFKKYALDLIDGMYEMCEELGFDTDIVDLMRNKITNPDLTYAKLLNKAVKEEGFIDFNLRIARENKKISEKMDYRKIKDYIPTILQKSKL